MKPGTIFLCTLLIVGLLVPHGFSAATGLSGESRKCISCHSSEMNDVPFAVVGQWEKSRHYQNNIGCFECHRAGETDPDAFLHHGYTISLFVTPKDCARCHAGIAADFAGSAHAGTVECTINSQASHLIQEMISADGFQSPVTKASRPAWTAGVTGCLQCHGSEIKLERKRKEKIVADPATWPNAGIGRINPDGSRGLCTACHQTHEFSVSRARQPETCGKCHTWGSGVPTLDIYKNSNHGTSYYTSRPPMQLDSKKWTAGIQFVAGPTCAGCHMSAARDMPATHNVSQRLNWDDPAPSQSPAAQSSASSDPCGGGFPPSKNPDCKPAVTGNKTQAMKPVCTTCHTNGFFNGYFVQYKNEKRLISEKYAAPATRLYNLAKAVLNALEDGAFAYFTHKIDFIRLDLSHYGSYAVSAAAMMSPDYTYTSGLKLSHAWFGEFIPELKQIIQRGLSDPAAQPHAQRLQNALEEILKNPVYGSAWAGKYDCVGTSSDTGKK